MVEAELRCALVHHPDELRHGAADVGCQRVGGVVRALDEGGREEVAHLQLLSRLEVDRRLSDCGSRPLDAHDVVLLRVLDREERRHQLREARHRNALVRVERVERLARRAVDQERRRCVHARRRRGGEGRRGCDEEEEQPGDAEEAPEHGRQRINSARDGSDRTTQHTRPCAGP